MKKINQNILAKNSTGNIGYFCSKCGREVAKDATICSNCGAKLGKIRCPFCNFVGEINDFKFDTCPKCGRKNKPAAKKNNLKKPTLNLPFSIKLFWTLLTLLIGILIILLYLFIKNFDLL